MDPRTWFKDLTGYFVYVLFIATLGPLLFGFHLVSNTHTPDAFIASLANNRRLSSMPPKM
jgi:hypothetical protein